MSLLLVSLKSVDVSLRDLLVVAGLSDISWSGVDYCHVASVCRSAVV